LSRESSAHDLARILFVGYRNSTLGHQLRDRSHLPSLLPRLSSSSREPARGVAYSRERSNKASLPRTFDVEIQFPSRESRDVSRPFPSSPSLPPSLLLSLFFLAFCQRLSDPFFADLISPGRRRTLTISTSFPPRADVIRGTRRA